MAYLRAHTVVKSCATLSSRLKFCNQPLNNVKLKPYYIYNFFFLTMQQYATVCGCNLSLSLWLNHLVKQHQMGVLYQHSLSCPVFYFSLCWQVKLRKTVGRTKALAALAIETFSNLILYLHFIPLYIPLTVLSNRDDDIVSSIVCWASCMCVCVSLGFFPLKASDVIQLPEQLFFLAQWFICIYQCLCCSAFFLDRS